MSERNVLYHRWEETLIFSVTKQLLIRWSGWGKTKCEAACIFSIVLSFPNSQLARNILPNVFAVQVSMQWLIVFWIKSSFPLLTVALLLINDWAWIRSRQAETIFFSDDCVWVPYNAACNTRLIWKLLSLPSLQRKCCHPMMTPSSRLAFKAHMSINQQIYFLGSRSLLPF